MDKEGKLLNQYKIKKLMKHAKDVTGIKNLDARALRHTFATMMLAAGVDIKTVAAWMGHSDLETTFKIYAQLELTRFQFAKNSMVNFVRS